MLSLFSKPSQTRAFIVRSVLKELIHSWQEYSSILNDSSTKIIVTSECYLKCKPSDKESSYKGHYEDDLHKAKKDLINSKKRLEDAMFCIRFIKNINPNIFSPIRDDLYVGTDIIYELVSLNYQMHSDACFKEGAAPSLGNIKVQEDHPKVTDIRRNGKERLLKLGNKLFRKLC